MREYEYWCKVFYERGMWRWQVYRVEKDNIVQYGPSGSDGWRWVARLAARKSALRMRKEDELEARERETWTV